MSKPTRWRKFYSGSGGWTIIRDPVTKNPTEADHVGCVAGQHACLVEAAPELLEVVKKHLSDMACSPKDHGDYYLEISNLIERAEAQPV